MGGTGDDAAGQHCAADLRTEWVAGGVHRKRRDAENVNLDNHVL